MESNSLYPGSAQSMPLTVLIADNDKPFLRLLAAILQSLGHCVAASAESSDAAVDWAVRHRPDVVIMGIQATPGIGMDTARKILLRSGVPVVCCLEEADANTLECIAEMGAAACLVKPFSPAQLEATLRLAAAHRHPVPAGKNGSWHENGSLLREDA